MGAFTMGSRKLVMLLMILGLSQIARAQSPTYGVGELPPRKRFARGTSRSVPMARNFRQDMAPPRKARSSLL